MQFADDVELGVDGVEQRRDRHRTDEAADGRETDNVAEHDRHTVEHLATIARGVITQSRV